MQKQKKQGFLYSFHCLFPFLTSPPTHFTACSLCKMRLTWCCDLYADGVRCQNVASLQWTFSKCCCSFQVLTYSQSRSLVLLYACIANLYTSRLSLWSSTITVNNERLILFCFCCLLYFVSAKWKSAK